MGKTIVIPDPREGFSMKIKAKQLIRPDLHEIAADLSISAKDVLFSNGVLTIYNTSQACQEIIDDNALVTFIAMAIDIPTGDISDITPVKAKPKIMEMDDMLDEDEED